MSIKIKDSTIKGQRTYTNIVFDINGKHIEVEVEQLRDEYAPIGETEYTYITGSSTLTEEEKDELDTFINDNY